MDMTQTSATLPRKVQLSAHQPARLIVRADGHTSCASCSLEIAYYVDRYLSGNWAHTGTDRMKCDTPAFNIAAPAPTCPACRSLDVTWTVEAWGNAENCAACGYHAFHSIGD
jgi:hypothetical protein